MIVVADVHLRHDKPVARKDDYWQAQATKFCFVLELARANPPLVIAGDLFDKARPPIPLVRWTLDRLIEYDVIPIVIAGQHDLPFHSLNHVSSSAIGILQAAGRADLLLDPTQPYLYDNYAIFGCPFGTSPKELTADQTHALADYTKLLVWHHLVIRKGEELWWGQNATIAGKVLRAFRQHDYIITGDNHQTFIETALRRRHINPGSMCRMSIDQIEHKPCVYDIEKDELIYLPVEDDVFDLTLSTNMIERENRISSFVEHLETGYEVSVDFERNLEIFMNNNTVSDRVQSYVREWTHAN